MMPPAFKDTRLVLDGGQTWEVADPASVNGLFIAYEYKWDSTSVEGYDATTVPVLIRATDWVNLSTVVPLSVTVDLGEPDFYTDISFSSPVGSHLDQGEAEATLTIEWSTPFDGSGTAVPAFGTNFDGLNSAFEQNPVPTVQLTEPITTVVVEYSNAYSGGYFIAVGAEDQAGNLTYETNLGPWFGSNMRSAATWAETLQSTKTDGVIGISNSEWLTETEMLDIDTRPAADQTLYATWDGARTWLGWQGAAWDTAGTMWVYYDVKAGGTTVPVTGTGGITLPFAADYAAFVPDSEVNEAGGGSFLQYFLYYDDFNGVWRTANNIETSFSGVRHDVASAGTEFRHGLEGLDGGPGVDTDEYPHYRMIAYAQRDSGEVWSAFPTSNGLDGNFVNYYEWEIVNDGFDLLNLPSGARNPLVTLGVSSDPPFQETVTENNTVEYLVELENIKDEAATGLTLDIETTAGLTLNTGSIEGATCSSCGDPTNITLSVADIAVGETKLVTITGQLASDLTSVLEVRLEANLSASDAQTQQDQVRHRVDIDGPTVTINTVQGDVINSGLQQIKGEANDGRGTGVALVEVSINGGSYEPITGTIGWSADVTIPNGQSSITVDVRATDYHGQVSPVASETFYVDMVPPEFFNLNVPSLVGGDDIVQLIGFVRDADPAPGALASVETVEIQIGDENGAWLSTDSLLYLTFIGDDQIFFFNWNLPITDGLASQVRFRATDFAGNQTISAWQATTVDTVAPDLQVRTHFTQTADTDPLPA